MREPQLSDSRLPAANHGPSRSSTIVFYTHRRATNPRSTFTWHRHQLPATSLKLPTHAIQRDIHLKFTWRPHARHGNGRHRLRFNVGHPLTCTSVDVGDDFPRGPTTPDSHLLPNEEVYWRWRRWRRSHVNATPNITGRSSMDGKTAGLSRTVVGLTDSDSEVHQQWYQTAESLMDAKLTFIRDKITQTITLKRHHTSIRACRPQLRCWSSW